MNRGLLSGLDKAEKDPYKGWNTNCFHGDSPENDEVCLLDDDNDDESSSSYRSTKCLSDGNRNPNDFQAKDNSYTIPKKVNAPYDKAKKGSSWFNSSFNEKDHTPSKNCHTRKLNTRMTHKNEIGYRMRRQGQWSWSNITPPSRWKHASPPGALSALRSKPSISQQEMILSCQVQEANTSEKCNGFESENTARTANTFNSLKEEQEHSKSMLDSILQGGSTKILSNTALGKEENTRTESTNSDANLKLKSSSPQLHDSLSSSKDVFSDDNYDDAFIEHCTKCMTRLSQDMCPACNKDIFPSHAATPRKHLSPCRFYSSNNQKLRTYSGTKKQGTGVPRLCAAPDTKPSSTKKSVGSSQATSRRKKRKNQGKSHSDDSDPEYQPGNKKRGGKQLKLDALKKVDVITLSDEEEIIGTENSEPKTEEAPELTIEESSQSDAKDSVLRSDSVNLVPESPNINSMESSAKSESTEKSGKRKAPLLEVHEEQQSKKKGGVYNRDDLELEIMIGQEVHLGTLACTAVEPLKITANGHSDEIKLSVDGGNKDVLLTISGKDLTSLKISRGQDPDVIVLGVTPGFALKLKHKFPTKGSFLDPGSAVASERDIVLEVSERVTKEIIHDLMDWVTVTTKKFHDFMQLRYSLEVSDKLSKDFAELSIKDVERIRSYKASTSPSAVKEKKQSPGETSSTSMTTRSRTYNTRTSSSRQAAANAVEKLIVYPAPPKPGGITVTSEDIPCLAPGQFLNDVIIDFYLKFVFFEKLTPEDRARTHILSSFFYKRLTQKNNKDSDSFTSTPDRMHSQVRTWTKNVDIFEKDFVFLPINESSHWYLAVICFAGHTEPTYINEILDEDEETQKKDSESDAATDKESQNDNNNDDDDDDDLELPTLTRLQSKSLSRNRRRSSLPKQSIKSQPCILVFDSLGCQRNRCMMNLRNYLACEWKERKKQCEPREFNKDNVRGNHPKVPEQDNFCDCGVYVLQYMESFFEDPITDFSFPIRKTDWFDFKTIAQKRNDIKELIYKLKARADSAGDT